MHPLVESADLKEIKTCLKRPRTQNDIQVFSGSHSFSDGQAVHPAEVGFLLVLASMLSRPAMFRKGPTAILPNGCMQDIPICWICLDTARPDAPLVTPCACPRQAHAQCLARWQLQSAGSR